MARTIIESIIPALASMFIGPWSDKFGRRPVIISSYVGEVFIWLFIIKKSFRKTFYAGYFLIYLSITVISYLSTVMPVNPWFYLLPYIPLCLCGGNCALITGVFSYLTDVTTQQDRAIRMAYLEAALYVGLLFGSVSSSYILKLTSPTTVFGISGITSFLGVLYVLFFVKESIQQDESIRKYVSTVIMFDATII